MLRLPCLLRDGTIAKLEAQHAAPGGILAPRPVTGGEDFPYRLHNVGWTKRMALLEAQNHRCAYCGVRFSGDRASPDYPTIDEVLPRVGGGKRIWSNQVMACWACNTYRGSCDAVTWFGVVERLGREQALSWGRLQAKYRMSRRDKRKRRAARKQAA